MISIDLYTIEQILLIVLVFCRVGSALMLFPGFGEAYIPMRIKVLMALLISIVLSFPLGTKLGTLPVKLGDIFILIFFEVLIGIFLGTITRILINVMNIVGAVFATQTGLGAAMLFDPNQGTQGFIVGNFLGMLALLIIILTDTHHIFLMGVYQSYDIFYFNQAIPLHEMSEMVAKTLADSFSVAVKMASPQIVIALIFFLGGGILSRLMPSIQIFFILAPLQILVGFYVLMITLISIMWYFHDYFIEVLSILF